MTGTRDISEDPRIAAASGSFRRAALATFAWAFLFGLLSFYWAAGGTIGRNTLSRSIQEMAEGRDPSFIATVWITGIAKVLGGLLPLALAFGWWRRVPRGLLRFFCWAGSAFLTLYGLGDVVRAVLVLTGAFEVDAPIDREIARWYLWLWGPVWITGGICYLATAWFHRRFGNREPARRFRHEQTGSQA